MRNSNPSLNPANNDSLTGLLNEVFKKQLQNVNVALPGTVIAYNNDTNRASIQPDIPLITTNGTQVPRAQISSIVVCQFGAGGWIVKVPVQSGDTGVLLACDRDISLFLQANSSAPPNTLRTHDFADSFFFPIRLSGYTIAPEDINNLVIQNDSGSVKMSFYDDKVQVTATTLAVVGNITASGSITEFTPPPP